MHDFQFRDGQLYCEDVPVLALAEAAGTPFYLYSYRTLDRHYRVFDRAFEGLPHLVCFSVKANSNLALLHIFAKAGGGVDIVSGGELYRALAAGIEPGKIVYSGVGKRIDEIADALRAGILMFNVESAQELELINEMAARMGVKAGIALRVNPDVDPQTHPHISTGLRENKFGIDIDRSLEQYRHARLLSNLDIKGVSCHIGSQVTKVSPFVEALGRIKKLIGRLKDEGMAIRYLDLGGGLGITYDQESPPHPSEYARAIREASGEMDCIFIFEPGRVIVGNAGILVTRVLYTKETEEKNFLIVDAGMNDLVRPSFYHAYHQILPVLDQGREPRVYDIVGPICESSDYLAKGRAIPRSERNDLLAVMSAGAYGFTMSSNYNSRPRIPEILVRGTEHFVIRRRETYADLISAESIPDAIG